MEKNLLNILSKAHKAEKYKDYDTAINLYKEALRLTVQNDDKAMLFEFIGQCHDKKGEEHLAFDNFGKAFDTNPEYKNGWYLYYRYAQLAYRFRQFGLSIEYLDKIKNEIPPDHENYIQYTRRLLGNNYLARKEYNRALSEFKKSLEINTDSRCKSYIYDGIAHASFGLDKIGKAIKFALKALSEEYDEVVEERMYFLLAFCYGMWGIYKNRQKENFFTEKLREVFPSSVYLRDLQRF